MTSQDPIRFTPADDLVRCRAGVGRQNRGDCDQNVVAPRFGHGRISRPASPLVSTARWYAKRQAASTDHEGRRATTGEDDVMKVAVVGLGYVGSAVEFMPGYKGLGR
jgi:hypothetical protein